MQKVSPIKQRIATYLENKGVSAYKFYKDSGMTRGVLEKKTGISEENIAKFIAYEDEINPNWLLTGKGKMFVGSQDYNSNTYVNEQQTKYQAASTGIPLIPIDAMAGWGEGDKTVMQYSSEKYVVPEFNEIKVDFLIKVKGGSMSPKYHSGDTIACKKIPLDTFIQWNKVYVLDTIQGAIVKRINQSEKDGCIQCISDNKEYPPFNISLKEVRSLALVVGVIRLE